MCMYFIIAIAIPVFHYNNSYMYSVHVFLHYNNSYSVHVSLKTVVYMYSIITILTIVILYISCVIRLPAPNWLILPTRQDKPVYLVSEKYLSLAAFTLAQEDFVAKVHFSYSKNWYTDVTHVHVNEL